MKIPLQSLNPLIYNGNGDANLMAALDLSDTTSDSGATPSPSPVQAINVQSAAGAMVNVPLPSMQDPITIANVTTSDSVSAEKHHIEFILSTGFTGTIGGITFRRVSMFTLLVTHRLEQALGSLAYTITAVSALLTSW